MTSSATAWWSAPEEVPATLEIPRVTQIRSKTPPYPAVRALSNDTLAEIAKTYGFFHNVVAAIRGDLRPTAFPAAQTLGVRVLELGDWDTGPWLTSIQQASALRLGLSSSVKLGDTLPALIIPQRPIACQLEDEGRRWYINPNVIGEVDESLASSLLRELVMDAGSHGDIAAFLCEWRLIDDVLERLCFAVHNGLCGPFVLSLPDIAFSSGVWESSVAMCFGDGVQARAAYQVVSQVFASSETWIRDKTLSRHIVEHDE